MAVVKPGRYRVERDNVVYNCPHCGAELRTKLDEAGSEQGCPDCLQPAIVPGVTEKETRAAMREEMLAQRTRLQQRATSSPPPPVSSVDINDLAAAAASAQARGNGRRSRSAGSANVLECRGSINWAAVPLRVIGVLCGLTGVVTMVIGILTATNYYLRHSADPDASATTAAIVAGGVFAGLPMLALGAALIMFVGIGKGVLEILEHLSGEKD